MKPTKLSKKVGGKSSDSCAFCMNLQCQFGDTVPSFCSKCRIDKSQYCQNTMIRRDMKSSIPVARMNADLDSMSGMDVAIGLFETAVRDILTFNTYENRFSMRGYIADIDNPANQYTPLKKEFLHAYAEDYLRRLYMMIDLVLNHQKVYIVNEGKTVDIKTPSDIRTAINNMSGVIGYYVQIRDTYKSYTDTQLIQQILELLKPYVISVDPSFRNPSVWKYANPFENFDLLINYTKLEPLAQKLMYIYYKYHRTAPERTKRGVLSRLRKYVGKEKTVLVPRNISQMADVGYIDPIAIERMKAAIARQQKMPPPLPPRPIRRASPKSNSLLRTSSRTATRRSKRKSRSYSPSKYYLDYNLD